MTATIYNQYYLDFPQFEHDRSFHFPIYLCRISFDTSVEYKSKSSGGNFPLYRFDVSEDHMITDITAPEGYNTSRLYLGLDQAPEELLVGLHRCTIYFSKDREEGMLAVGRGTLLVLQKWPSSV